MGCGIPQWLGYAASTLIVIPLVIYGMKALSKLQVWTTPLWLLLMVVPVGYLVISHPDSIREFFAFMNRGAEGTNLASVMLAAGVCLSLMAQIAEQIDYLRFMPPKTAENRAAWWRAVILAGPGWVIFGAIKQIVGTFHAILYPIANLDPSASVHANQPAHQFLGVYQEMMPAWLAMTLAVVLVVISQRSQHVRIPEHHSWFLRELRHGMGGYSRVRYRHQQILAQDFRRRLRVTPRLLYAVNRSALSRCWFRHVLSIAVFFGAFGSTAQPYSPIFAVGLALVLPPRWPC